MPASSEAAGKRPYLHLIEGYRGIAATAVVLHHVGAIVGQHYHLSFVGGFFSACHLRLDFFFVLSGFIIAWLHENEIGQPKLSARFLWKRLARIYPLLFILTTVKLASVMITMDGRWAKDQMDLLLIISSYLMLPSDRFPLILAAWTMPYEVMFYLVFAGAILMGRRWLATTAAVWVLVIAAGNLFPPAQPNLLISFLLKPFHLQLFAGMGTAMLVRRTSRTAWGSALMVTAFTMLFFGLIMHEQVEALPILHKRCWWGLIFCLLIGGTALFEMGRSTPVNVPGWLKMLGKGSYSIYLVHSPVIIVLLAFLAPRGLLDGSASNPLLLLIACVSIIAGLICYQTLERPLHAAMKRLQRRTEEGKS